jgi:hypothetical protein
MRRWGAFVILLAGLAGLLTLDAGAGRAADDFKPEEGFVSLFNGKDLSGWRYGKEDLSGKTETADKRFTVENGIIVANEGKGIKDLFTVKEFDKPFQLKLEFRAGPKADSGVYVRGPQLQVRDWMRRNEHKELTRYKNDDWNELDITVQNGVLVSSVNGKPLTDQDVLELTVRGGKAEARLNGGKVDPNNIQVAIRNVGTCLANGEKLIQQEVANLPVKGPIGLQAETGKFEFRRVRIKEMP